MADCNCKHGTSGAGGVCVECDIPQLARNNYFTGKLLVERDFTDEQRYLLGKLRRHNQRLHGWGAVCGLKVKPHPTCPDRFVIIEPGTAIDCCGREILVSREEYFEFRCAVSGELAETERAKCAARSHCPAQTSDLRFLQRMRHGRHPRAVRRLQL